MRLLTIAIISAFSFTAGSYLMYPEKEQKLQHHCIAGVLYLEFKSGTVQAVTLSGKPKSCFITEEKEDGK